MQLTGAISITDQDSNVIADSSIVYQIDVKNGCEFDVQGVDANPSVSTVADITYTIGSGYTPLYYPGWTQTIATCPVES